MGTGLIPEISRRLGEAEEEELGVLGGGDVEARTGVVDPARVAGPEVLTEEAEAVFPAANAPRARVRAARVPQTSTDSRRFIPKFCPRPFSRFARIKSRRPQMPFAIS